MISVAPSSAASWSVPVNWASSDARPTKYGNAPGNCCGVTQDRSAVSVTWWMFTVPAWTTWPQTVPPRSFVLLVTLTDHPSSRHDRLGGASMRHV
ncbi:hypothetical protein ACFXGA_25385 [Actinosynnema sp. NPDC059335]|uniref:hypothetical protein n=1 Tax=Actinosynnema sp. NPDC059335 TaxID=3346804 RepID=UPI00366A78BF